MKNDDREPIKAAFQTHPKESAVRILLAADAASEGVNLQNHCSKLIHFEIPWNPNRMEQRNGRVDRHGQKADEVHIHHFVGRGFDTVGVSGKVGDLEGDLEFLMRAALFRSRRSGEDVPPTLSNLVRNEPLDEDEVEDAEAKATAAKG